MRIRFTPDTVTGKQGDGVYMVIAPDGYQFESIVISGFDWIGDWKEFVDVTKGHEWFNEDSTICSIPDGVIDEDADSLRGECSLLEYEGGGGEDGGVVNSVMSSYLINRGQFENFNKIIWNSEIDVSYGLHSIYTLPIEMPDDIVSDDIEDIYFGNFKSTMKGYQLKDDKLIYDLGNIHVEHKYNNVYDYKDTIVTLYIPYSLPINLDTNYVIGKTINVKYVIDFLNKNCSYYIENVDTGSMITKGDVDMVRTLPFAKNGTNQFLDMFEVSPYVYNTLVTAYIEVRRSTPVGYTNCISGVKTNLCGYLGDLQGYVKVNDVDVVGLATVGEKELIRSKLIDGVYIK